jgi:hypothetical protein
MDVAAVLAERREWLTRRRNENALLESQALEQEEFLLSAAEKMQLSTEALEFLEEVANSRRGSIKSRLESILTEALQLVYDKSRSIELTYTVKANRSFLAFEIVRETPNGKVRRVLDGTGSGLGVSDTVSVPLRLLVLLGSKQADRVCVLDESYRHLGNERVPLAAQFLKVLTERLGVQVILLSHHEALRSDVDAAYEVREGKSSSTISRVS